MDEHAAVEDDDRDWRLAGELTGSPGKGVLHALVEQLRDPEAIRDIRAAVSDDVVITHDGDRLYAYASGRATIERARQTIEAVLDREGHAAQLALSHYSGELDEWVDPDSPATVAAERNAATAAPETRTLVATVGREIREEFEQSIRTWADQLGLRCEIIEHPHLMDSQVAFTVTGPRRKVDEFASGLRAEERQTIRTQQQVMLSPL